MRIDEKTGVLLYSKLLELRARLAMVNAAIIAMERYGARPERNANDNRRLRPFLLPTKKGL